MKALIALSVMLFLAPILAFANPPIGVGNGPGMNINPTNVGAMPPGLEDSGTPPGLNKLDKTPYGWSQGEKTGWSKQHKQPKGHQH